MGESMTPRLGACAHIADQHGHPHTVQNRGCDVVFPHQAYGVQLSFMNKCVQSLEGGRNALLEAPTGRWSMEFHCKAKDKDP